MEHPEGSNGSARLKRQYVKLKYGHFLVTVLLSLMLLSFSFYMIIMSEENSSIYVGLITLVVGYWFGNASLVKKSSTSLV